MLTYLKKLIIFIFYSNNKKVNYTILPILDMSKTNECVSIVMDYDLENNTAKGVFFRVWRTIKTIDVFKYCDSCFEMEIIFKDKYDFNPIVAHHKIFIDPKFSFDSYHWYAIKDNTSFIENNILNNQTKEYTRIQVNLYYYQVK